MRTGGPASAASAHNGTESAPIPVRLTENGLTTEGAALEPFPALLRVLARKRNRSTYLISYISLWEGDSFAESSKNTEKEVL